LGNWAREQLYLHPSPDGKLLFIGHNSGEKKNNIFKGMVVNWEFEAVNYFTIELGKKGWVALNEAYVSNEGHVVFQDYDKDETYAIWPDEEEVQKFDLNENDMRISGLTAQLHNGSLFVSGSLTGSKKYDGLDGIFLTNLSSDGDHDHLIYKKLSEEDVRDIMTEDELDMIREKKVEDKRKKKKKKKRKKKKKKKKKKKNKSLIPETRNGMVIRGLRKIGETYVMDAEVYYWYVVVTQTDKTTTTTYHYVYKDIFLFGFDAKSGDHLWSQRIEKYRHTINDQGQKGGYAVHQGDNSLDFIFIVRPESLGDKINMKECEPERDIYEPKDNRKNQERFILVRINEHGEKEYFNYGDVYKKLHNAVVLDPLMNNKEECRFYLPAYHYMKLNFEED
jgi:hypothetical protein